jgi:DNA polymerase delta subunit 1
MCFPLLFLLCWYLGKEAADLVTQQFNKPIKLEFEKIFCPFLLMNKKRYAGVLYTSPEKYSRLDFKGIEVNVVFL